MANARPGRGFAEDDRMKRMVWITIGTLLLLGAGLASAQSLGDVARSTRKEKAQQNPSTRHYDNDNLPKGDHLSVVGPPPAATADGDNQTEKASGQAAPAAPANGGDQTGEAPAAPAAPATASPDPKTSAQEGKKPADDWSKKIDEQKQKLDTLSRDLDLTQREYQLRAAAMYSDVGNRLRNAAAWDKEDADFKKQLDEKQKAVDAAKQQLDDLQEEARKAGAPAADRE
jgi:hypothetical protein